LQSPIWIVAQSYHWGQQVNSGKKRDAGAGAVTSVQADVLWTKQHDAEYVWNK
jgi:hypothetical protein